MILTIPQQGIRYFCIKERMMPKAIKNMFNKTMGCMMREVFKGSYHVSLLTTVIFIAGLAYVVSPFDLVPDTIFFFGWLDDLLVVFLIIKRLQKESQRYIRFKVMERRGN